MLNRNEQKIFLALILFLICGIVFLFAKHNIGRESINIVKSKKNNSKVFFEIYVCGKVISPGVYRVSSQDNLKILLERAGVEQSSGEAQFSIISPSCAINKYVNINFAGKNELEQLPGIGEKLAERIIAYRKQHNGFKTKEELKNVAGIGEKKFNAITDFINVSLPKIKEIPAWFVIRSLENNKAVKVNTLLTIEEILKTTLNSGSAGISKYIKLELK